MKPPQHMRQYCWKGCLKSATLTVTAFFLEASKAGVNLVVFSTPCCHCFAAFLMASDIWKREYTFCRGIYSRGFYTILTLRCSIKCFLTQPQLNEKKYKYADSSLPCFAAIPNLFFLPCAWLTEGGAQLLHTHSHTNRAYSRSEKL